MLYTQEFLIRLENGLRAALAAWDIGPGAQLSLLNISENATFRVDDSADSSLILRVHRPYYHTPGEIMSELDWIEALRRDRIVETPAPVPTRDGARLVEFFDGEVKRHAVAFEYMPGKEPDPASDQVMWFRHIGEVTARLHCHSRNWKRPPGFERKVWDFDTILGARGLWGDWRDAPGLDAAGIDRLAAVHGLLQRQTKCFGRDESRFGLVHCDMRAANLLIDGSQLAVIDFDDCGFSWFGFDFATAVSFIEHEPIVDELMTAWLEGYRKVSVFSEADATALPMFVMLRRMQLTAWIASHSETETARSMGEAYVRGTVQLAEDYLLKHADGGQG